jgi:hypothetical protein
MKPFIYCLLIAAASSCKQNKPVVQKSFIDSLLANYAPSPMAVTNQKDLEFWKSRVDTMPESFVNLQKYSSALAMRFHIYGDISYKFL